MMPYTTFRKKLLINFLSVIFAIVLFSSVMYIVYDPDRHIASISKLAEKGVWPFLAFISLISVAVYYSRKSRVRQLDNIAESAEIEKKYMLIQITSYLIAEVFAFISVLLYYFSGDMQLMGGAIIAVLAICMMYPRISDLPEHYTSENGN